MFSYFIFQNTALSYLEFIYSVKQIEGFFSRTHRSLYCRVTNMICLSRLLQTRHSDQNKLKIVGKERKSAYLRPLGLTLLEKDFNYKQRGGGILLLLWVCGKRCCFSAFLLLCLSLWKLDHLPPRADKLSHFNLSVTRRLCNCISNLLLRSLLGLTNIAAHISIKIHKKDLGSCILLMDTQLISQLCSLHWEKN